MATGRKLLVEIEKCFKKIDEGVEIFEETMSKVNEANSENQRDKLQDDLKKEIKKLQRLREQVKGWQGCSEIKDKDKLNHYRRLVETQMETFKNLEREFKTKPHSKQGLSAEDKLDPKEKTKSETLEWLNTQIRTIQDEIDRTEAKFEALSTAETTGKKRGKSKDAKKVEKEQVEELQKHLDKMKFHWKNIEVCMRLITNEKLDPNKVITKLREPLSMYTEALDSDCDEDLENLEPDDIYEELGLGDYISRLDAAVNPLDDDNSTCKGLADLNLQTDPPVLQIKNVHVEAPKPPKPKSVVSISAPPVLQPVVQSVAPPIQPVILPPVPQPSAPLPMSYANVVKQGINTLIVSPPAQVSTQNFTSPSFEMKSVKMDFGFAGRPLRLPNKEGCNEESELVNDPRYSRILTGKHLFERNYVPLCRAPNISKAFPDHLVIESVSDEYFEKLELGTVLFSFYYMEGTKAQLLAARRLKSCSWRFHTHHLMWFQRADEPIETTAEYERGRYVFFDYNYWEFYVKDDFRFYYRYLDA